MHTVLVMSWAVAFCETLEDSRAKRKNREKNPAEKGNRKYAARVGSEVMKPH